MTAPPTFVDVAAARKFVAQYLSPTPLVHCWSLSQQLSCDYYAKCENLQPMGAFKVRGGINLVGQLDAESRERGIISASTGNHGQSLAFAGQLFGVRVVIYGPEQNSNPDKVAAMRRALRCLDLCV